MIPVFVLSPGRSGTTLLMSILERSPHILCPGDHPKEERLVGLASVATAVLSDPDAGRMLAEHAAVGEGDFALSEYFAHMRGVAFDAELFDLDRIRTTVMAAIWASVGSSARASGVRYYAEKSIGLQLPPYRDRIESRVIHLVRDPRDILVSVREFNRRRGIAGFGWKERQSELDYAVDHVPMYRLMLEGARDAASDPHQITIRYEDMVSSPTTTAKRLAEWLGVDFPDRLEIADAGEHGTSGSPRDSIGRWRSELGAETAAMLRHELGELLDGHGYSVA